MQNVIRFFLLWGMLVFSPAFVWAQVWMIGGGAVLQFGEPVQRVGFQVQARLDHPVGAVLAGIRWQYNLAHYGPPGPFREWLLWSDVRLGIGPHRQRFPLERSLVNTPLERRGTIGYGLRYFVDTRGTSQLTGSLLLRAGPWWLEVENDALVPGRSRDRFRTGGLRLGWQEGRQRVEARVVLWHGDTKGGDARNIRQSAYPGRFGYRDFSDCQYGGFSNGILAVEYTRFLRYRQSLHFQGGVDAEQIRHFFQNRVIHDMWWMPPSWTTVRNPHYPMLDTEGEPYLGEEGQEIRRIRPVLQAGLNQSFLY